MLHNEWYDWAGDYGGCGENFGRYKRKSGAAERREEEARATFTAGEAAARTQDCASALLVRLLLELKTTAPTHCWDPRVPPHGADSSGLGTCSLLRRSERIILERCGGGVQSDPGCGTSALLPCVPRTANRRRLILGLDPTATALKEASFGASQQAKCDN